MVSTRGLCRCALGLIAVVTIAHAQYGEFATRSLLEKKIYYITNGKIGTASFWSLYLGDHKCGVPKYFPGEGDVVLDANVNYSLLSSGYIEGKGYASRGKVDSDGLFAVLVQDSLKTLPLDSIEYVYAYGAKVKPVGAEETDLVLYTSGRNRLTIKRLLIRMFTFDKAYGELKPAGDSPIQGFAFSKEAAAKALAAQKNVVD